MPHEMNHRERLETVWRGERPDHLPISIWRHFPEIDQSADKLAETTVAWQTAFDFDFVKFMPSGDYPVIDWGLTSEYAGSPSGVRQSLTFPVSAPEHWSELNDLDVETGMYGQTLEALHLTHQSLGPDVPLFQTIFSPLTIAMKLSDGAVLNHLESHPASVHAALSLIASVTRRMLNASLDRGATGIFFATQCADRTVMPEATYRAFGLTHDIEVLDPFALGTFMLLHLHGAEPMLNLASEYPPAALNWHDRRTGPSLSEGTAFAQGPVTGGINETTFASTDENWISAEVKSSLAAMADRPFIVAPGCVVGIAAPEANMLAAVQAVRAQ